MFVIPLIIVFLNSIDQHPFLPRQKRHNEFHHILPVVDIEDPEPPLLGTTLISKSILKDPFAALLLAAAYGRHNHLIIEKQIEEWKI